MNPELLTTIILAIVGWVIAGFLALKFVKKRKPVWAYRTIPILGIHSKTPPDLKLFFNDKAVDDVYRTLVIFFNAGNQTIEASDVRKQVTLVFDNAKILCEPKLNANDTAIEFSTEWSTSGEYSEVRLNFKCLDHNDGAVIEVIHDGKGKVSCDGRIKETREIAFLGDFTPSFPKQFQYGLIVNFVATFLFLGMSLLWLFTVGGIKRMPEPSYLLGTVLFFGIFGYVLWASIRALLRRGRFPTWSAISK